MSLLASSPISLSLITFPHLPLNQGMANSRIGGRLFRNIDGSIEILPHSCGEIFGQKVLRPIYDLSLRGFHHLNVKMARITSFLSLPGAYAETVSSLEPIGHQGELAVSIQQNLSSFLVQLSKSVRNFATREAIFTLRQWMEEAENDFDTAEKKFDEQIAEKLEEFCKAIATSKMTLSTILKTLNTSTTSPYSLEKVHEISLSFPRIYPESSTFKFDRKGIEVNGKKTISSDNYGKNPEGCGKPSFKAEPPPFLLDLDKFSKVFNPLYTTSEERALEKASEFFSEPSLTRMKKDFLLWKAKLNSIDNLVKAASAFIRLFEDTKREELERLFRQIKDKLSSFPQAKQFQIDLKITPEIDEMVIVVEQLSNIAESAKASVIWLTIFNAEVLTIWVKTVVGTLFGIPEEHVGTFLLASVSSSVVLTILLKYSTHKTNNPSQAIPFQPADLPPQPQVNPIDILDPQPLPDPVQAAQVPQVLDHLAPTELFDFVAKRPTLDQRYPSDWLVS